MDWSQWEKSLLALVMWCATTEQGDIAQIRDVARLSPDRARPLGGFDRSIGNFEFTSTDYYFSKA